MFALKTNNWKNSVQNIINLRLGYKSVLYDLNDESNGLFLSKTKYFFFSFCLVQIS